MESGGNGASGGNTGAGGGANGGGGGGCWGGAGSAYTFYLSNSSSNTLSNLTVTQSNGVGGSNISGANGGGGNNNGGGGGGYATPGGSAYTVYLANSSSNTLSNLTVTQSNGNAGAGLDGGGGNNNGGGGAGDSDGLTGGSAYTVYLDNSSSNNALSNITVTQSGGAGGGGGTSGGGASGNSGGGGGGTYGAAAGGSAYTFFIQGSYNQVANSTITVSGGTGGSSGGNSGGGGGGGGGAGGAGSLGVGGGAYTFYLQGSHNQIVNSSITVIGGSPGSGNGSGVAGSSATANFSLFGSSWNTLSNIAMSGANGLSLDINSSSNTIIFSTFTSLARVSYFGYQSSGAYNNVAQSNFSGYYGAVLGGSSAKFNNISYSTMSSSSGIGLYLNRASSNTIASNYIQGSTAVYVFASTGATIGDSLLVSTYTSGLGLALSNGSSNLTLSSSTVLSGSQGAGIYLDSYNSGVIDLSSNVITGGRYGLNIATQSAGAALLITSMTFSPLAAGTTAINFLGGTFVSTFTGISFNSANTEVNVNASLLEPASRITMLSYYGSKAGPPVEVDPNNLVDWPCQPISSVGPGAWSNPAIWSQGFVPLTCSPVTISAGDVVTLDILNAVSSGAVINGTLMASRTISSSWTLVGGDINVNPGGTLDYGNESNTIPESIYSHLVLSYGAFAGQYGLIVNNGGNFTVRGSTKTPYSFATADMTAAQTNLTVYGSTSTEGWQVGDVITIGPTSGNAIASTSSRTITGVDHLAGSNLVSWSGTEPLGTARILAEGPILVSNITRNVLVQSSGTFTGSNTAYIRNLTQNSTSFSLTHGEFAYLGANAAGKYGITFDGALTKGSISSATIRNGYDGIHLNSASGNILLGNNSYANSQYGIYILSSSNDNILTGNNFYSNSSGVALNGVSNNSLTGNNSYSNAGYGLTLNGSNNTLAGNNSYSNSASGIYLYNGSSNNTLTGSNVYSNVSYGIYLNGANNSLTRNNSHSNSAYGILIELASNNTLTENNIYSNANYGIYDVNSASNTFIDGSIGYNAAGDNLNNATAEIYFEPGTSAAPETLVLKGTRVNPAVGISTAGMDVPWVSLVSYNQEFDTGTVRIWGDYRVTGSTLTLDYAQQLYASTATTPKLMRGTGHSASVVSTYDDKAVSQLITITYRSGLWHVNGSSAVADMIAFVGNTTSLNVPLANPQFKLAFTQGTDPQDGDMLDFVLTAASKDANLQKKLLFGPSATGFNNGRSRLQADETSGVILRGKTDGSAPTLVDWLSASSTYYTFVDSGAFTAAYSSFTNMDPGGIQLSGSGGVAISSSSFDYLGFASGTNTYITARNLTSNATMDNVSFGLQRSSAGYDSAYNVRVEGLDNDLNWSFTQPSGVLWGERYDSDIGNKVNWINCGPLASAKDGSWSDIDTWNSGIIPSACNTVTVAAGHVVTIDIMNAVSGAATINGTLAASRLVSSSWTLVGGDINVNAGGTLDYGNEANTIPTVINSHLVLASGTYAGQYGLIVNNGGNFTVRGSTKAPYSFATASIGVGATSLQVYGSTSVAGWQAGDVITIGPTTGNGSATTAARTITNIDNADPVYTINWTGGLDSARTLASTSPIIVGNLTRNVLVRSSGTSTGTNSAYIVNLVQNTTSFSLTQGEFAYLGNNLAGKEGISFNGDLTKGSVSSSTIRGSYYGIALNSSSSNTFTGNNAYATGLGISLNFSPYNTLIGNNLYSSLLYGISLYNSPNNTLTGNYSYSNLNIGIYSYSSSNNTLTANKAYSNSSHGMYLSGSSSNTLSSNNVYDNSNVGISFEGLSRNNTVTGNNYYSNAYGVYLWNGPSHNTFIGNNIYSNSGYGVYADGSSSNTFVGANLGYSDTGASLKNVGAEVYFQPGAPAESLLFKGVQVNPVSGINVSGMNLPGASLVSYNQDTATGTVRIWGNYQLAGSTLTLDYATQLYASTATAPKLMRGTGHSITNIVTHDAGTLSELITVMHTGGDFWRVQGSATGLMGTVPCPPLNSNCPFTTAWVDFKLNAGAANGLNDALDFVTIAASNDANMQKKLLFGYAAADFNSGRSKLEIASNAGVVLKGKPDGTANTLVEMIAGNSTYYTFVDSGAFTAEHSSFTNMEQGGIQLSGSGGVVISSSTFDYLGFASGTNTYITLRNLTSNATFYGVAFELGRSSAGYDSAYNVRVEENDSNLFWHFLGEPSELGPLWGEAYNSELGPSNKVLWGDLDPPAAVSDLSYTGISTNTITLNWLATGDDGMFGILNKSSFTVQYSTDSAVAWSTGAAQVNISTSGVEPGTSQYYTLGGLSANTSYYFRLWSKDEAANYSTLSNGITALTLIETPTSVYIDEVGTTTIVASAYAPTFTGMNRGISGVAVATGTYELWGSTGNYWATRTGMPAGRYKLAAAALGGKLYAVGGQGGLTSNTEFDPVLNTWTTRAPMPTGRYMLAAAVVGDKLYAIGGDNGGEKNANEEYDPVSNTWTTKAPMPTPRRGLSAGVIRGRIYVVGGYYGGVLATNEEYNPATDTWVGKTGMPTARHALAVGVTGGKLYAVGGNTGFTYYTNNEEYDPATNGWTTKAGISAGSEFLSVGAIGGKLYAVGGTGRMNVNEEYDPGSNTWTTKADMPTARYWLTAAVLRGKFYALGGSPDNLTPIATNEEYNPGVAGVFNSLTPNTLYTFKARARNQAGVETGDSVTVSTYTLAAIAQPAGPAFTNILASTVTVNWSSGTASGGFNGPGASYLVQASTMSTFLPVLASSTTNGISAELAGLYPNTTHYFRAQAYNAGGMTDYSWLTLGSTVTAIETPTSVYIDEVGTTSIVASAYSSTLTGMERGISGVNITTDPVYGVWGSTGNYWTTRAVMPTPRFGLAVGVVGGKLYAVGGYDGVSYKNENEEYDPAFNTWTSKAAMPTPRYQLAVGAVGRKLYAIGGIYGGGVNNNEEYDPVSNTWAIKVGMPSVRNAFAIGVLVGKIYAVGGGGYSNQNEEYDPLSDSWATREVMPTGRGALAAGTVGGKLYAVGGANGSYLSQNEEYDPVSNSWLTRAGIPIAVVDPAAGVIGGKMYVVGGFNGSYSNQNAEYNPESNNWVIMAVMPTARDRLAVGVVGGKLYAVGGSPDFWHNEEYTPGVSRPFSGLTPNTQYSFKSKARNQYGVETGESVTVSTYTLAAIGLSTGATYANVTASSVTVNWSSGTAGAFNGPGARFLVQASTAANYTGSIASSSTYNTSWATLSLGANTTYYFRAQAYNTGGMTDYSWLALGSTVTQVNLPLPQPIAEISASSITAVWNANDNTGDTLYNAHISTEPGFASLTASTRTIAVSMLFGGISANTTYYLRVNALNRSGSPTAWQYFGSTITHIETPTAVYFDEVSSYSITASAYAPGPAFTAMERGISGVNITTAAEYGVWGSTGNYWMAKTVMPTGRYGLSVTAIGGKLYALGGYNLSNLNINQVYDPVSNTWDTKSPMTTPRYNLKTGSIAGKLYAIGGYDSSTLFNKNEVYDPESNTWSTKADMPTARMSFAIGVIDGKLYAIGGMTQNVDIFAVNEVYDPVYDAWSTKAEMPTPRFTLAAGVLNGKLYAVGGANGVRLDKNEEYNPISDAWATKAPMPTTRQDLSVGVVGDKLYVVGGFETGGTIGVNEVYDAKSDTWTEKAAMPTVRNNFSIGVVNGKLYAIGGNNSGNSYQTTNEEYNPGVSQGFAGLTANTQYSFRAKVRNQAGVETAETVAVSTYTLAARPGAAPAAFTGVYESSFTANWVDNGNPVGTTFYLQLSTASSFSAIAFSSATINYGLTIPGLFPNTTYYSRVAAMNGGGLYTDYLLLGSTITRIESPSSVYIDEVGTTAIVASAYAPGFTGLERGISGVNITTSGVYGVWGSTGNYWETKALMPWPRYMFGAVAVGGKIFAVAGSDAGVLSYNSEYDPVSNTWTAKTGLPLLRYGFGIAAVGGKYYVIGGYQGTRQDANDEYDPEANAWTSKAPMPGGARYNLAAAAIGGKLYAVGGINTGYTALNEEYDPATNIWTTKAPLPAARGGIAAAAAGGKLYALGGTSPGMLTKNEEYDPATNSWVTKASMTKARQHLAAVVLGGKVYALGGEDGVGKLNINEEYDPAADTWVTKVPMPTVRYGLSAAVSGGRVYALGGNDGSSFLGVNEAYTPGVARSFAALKPNTLYTFKAKARNQSGTESAESITVSTYTLAAIAMPESGLPFTEVFASSIAVIWSSGTASGGYNGPGAHYVIQASTIADFRTLKGAWELANVSVTVDGLNSNTTHYFRAQAYNSGNMTDYSWLVLGSTVTNANIPSAAAAPFSTVGVNDITLHWGTSGNSDGTSYKLQFSTNSDFSEASIVYPVTSSSPTLSGVLANTTYYARVAAVSYSGIYTDYFVIGATITAIESPTTITFNSISSNTIITKAHSAGGFTNLDKEIAGISQAIGGVYGGWAQTVISTFPGLTPNMPYNFAAKARNQAGRETAESVTVSTYTLATVSLPVSGPVFANVHLTSATVNWSSGTASGGFNGPGASYILLASSAPDFSALSAFSLTASNQLITSGLWTNTTYYYNVQAFNSANVPDPAWLELGSTSTLTNPVTGAAVLSVFSTSVTISWNVLPPTPSSSTCEGYLVDASTAADFSGTVHSSATSSQQLAAIDVINLFADATYYFRVGSLNWSGTANYAAAGSTKTLTETEPPWVTNNELYDYSWYSSNSRIYNVDFNDTGGSALSRFMVKAATATNEIGMVAGADWTSVVTDISSDSYTADWQLPDGFWDLLQDGTNYISVRVYDGSGNTDTHDDAFVVFKDTTPPSIAENVDDTIWQSTSGAVNNLNFADAHSKINGVQYTVWSSSGLGGTQLVPWLDIAVNLTLPSYNSNFVIGPSTWTLLQSGTNYVTLKTWDYALAANTNIWIDAFAVLKDTVAPGAINSLLSVTGSTYSAQISFMAPEELPSGIAEYAVQYASYTVAWATSSVAGSSHVYVSTSGISYGAPQSLEISGLLPNATYYFRAWARDQAGNWSADSNSAPAVTLAEMPGFAGLSALYFSSAAVSWTPVDSRGYVLDASTSASFIGVLYSSSTGEPSVSSLEVSGLLPNTTYHFRVGSLNWTGIVNYAGVGSNSTYAVGPGSATVYADVSSRTVTVEWLSNSNGPATRYVVEASSDEFTTLTASSVAVPGYGPYTLTFDGLFPNTTYWFKVLALGNHDDSSPWLMLGSTVTLPVPPIITGYALWASSASITWDPNGNGAGTFFECDLSTVSDFTAAEVSTRTTSLALELPLLSPNATYYMRLRTLSAVSRPSVYVQDSGLSLAFGPSWLSAVAVGPNNAWLYWDAARNPGGLSAPSWSGTGALPAARYGHTASVAGDTILITGGSDGSGYRSDAWYAPLSVTGQVGGWTQGRSLPGARYGHTSAALKGRLYIIGGYDGTAPKADVWSAPIDSSGGTGEWVSEPSLPQAVYAHATVVAGGRIYVLGGYGAGARPEVYHALVNDDGTLGAWTAATSLLQARYSHAAVVSISTSGARLYITGGNDGSAARPEALGAGINGDGSLSAWTPVTSLPSPLFAHGMAAVPGALFVVGGSNGTVGHTAVLRAAVNPDGTLGGWTAQTALPQALHSHTLLERGGRLLALGGYDSGAAKQASWLSLIAGTEYALSVTGASFSSTPWQSSGGLEVGGLKPNTYHTFAAAARNFAGVVTAYSPALSTYTYAAQPSAAPFGGVWISSIQVNWLPGDNPAGTVYNIELSSDEAHTQQAAAMSAAVSSAVFTGLDNNHLYYARARALNAVNIYTAWTNLGSTTTRSDPSLDFSSPTLTNNQAGDNVWRNSANAVYNIDFADTGGAYLSHFQIRASTTAGEAGPFSPDWSAEAAGINANSYTADWSLVPGHWLLLLPGTNYISVRAFDWNGNSTTTADAFYILKDTALPVITDNQSGEVSWRMDDAGPVYDVDFADALSGLGGIEYSASVNQGSGDAAALSWRPIAGFTQGASSYTAAWGIDFAALVNNATNYISVRTWDLAGNTVTVSGIDVFKILKYVSGPEVAITAPAAVYESSVPAITGTVSDARSHPASGVEVSVKLGLTGRYWNGSAFLASSQKWMAASGTETWTYTPGINWFEGLTYEVVARSSDSAGNYSLVYATRSFTFDSQAPVLFSLSPADASVVNSAASISGLAADISGLSELSLKLKRVSDGKWWDFGSGTWTVSGSSAAVAAASNWTYAPSELLKASLETQASYYFTLYAADNSSPAGSVPFGVYGSTFAFLDDTAPSAITDFAGSTGNAPGNISLAWHAPGDDGAAGMILYGQYRIQYSTAAGTAFSKDDAQSAYGFTSGSAGSARSIELTALVPGETYYLRAWTRDDAGNWSALSNGATAQASPYPDRISGHVMKVSSEGITGVLLEAFDTVGILRASAFTVADGSGSYVLSPLPAGSYRVQATWTADDIISSVGSDGIVLGATNADFTLAINYELASIGGELVGYRISPLGFRAQGARPLGAAYVELYQRNRLIATAPIDAAGRFLIKNLLPGKYLLKVPNADGGTKELSLTLKPGEALIISPLGELLKEDKVYAYPNPAGKTVKFHIESDQPSLVKQVTVFDITGRAIKEFNDADFAAITATAWEAEWSIPSKVASGVYIYITRVKLDATGEHKKTVKKFAIIK